MNRTASGLIVAWMAWAGVLPISLREGQAGDWPGWRGPTGAGCTDEKDLPLKWDGKTGQNVFWKASLEGTTGHACPIVWGDRFATAGKSYVIQAGPKLEVLAANDLRGESNGSSPAVSAGRIFLRGNKALYCIGAK
jgi:hypothetical protein